MYIYLAEIEITYDMRKYATSRKKMLFLSYYSIS